MSGNAKDRLAHLHVSIKGFLPGLRMISNQRADIVPRVLPEPDCQECSEIRNAVFPSHIPVEPFLA